MVDGDGHWGRSISADNGNTGDVSTGIDKGESDRTTAIEVIRTCLVAVLNDEQITETNAVLGWESRKASRP